MNLFLAVTDNEWFRFLRSRAPLEEINFWQPGSSGGFERFIRVTSKLKDDFDSGEPYYPFDGEEIWVPPHPREHPNREFLEWHGDVVFRG